MFSYPKQSYLNIDRERFIEELDKKGAYFSNVTVWTIIFSVPLFWLLDLLFIGDQWYNFMFIRFLVGAASYFVFWFGTRNKWHYLLVLNLVVALNVIFSSMVCGLLGLKEVLPYFLLFSVMMLLINATAFWEPAYPVIHCSISYFIIVILYGFKPNITGYSGLVENGGGVYFLVSAFSCLLASNRYQLITREIEKILVISKANHRLLEQNEHINDQRMVIEEANRRLKNINDYRQNTLSLMIHDLKNFVGSNQMSIDLISRKSGNLTTEQKEILSYINMGNKKLHYLSGKLADSAEIDTGQVEYRYEEFDAVVEIENAAIGLVDAAALRDVSIQSHLSPEPILLYLDRIFFNHILYKLIANAVRFTEQGSAITIHASKAENSCVIEVIDTGKALGMVYLDDLFSKIKEVSEAQSVTNQTGFGFSAAKLLTESMGGTLHYSCGEEKGNFYQIKFKLA